MPALTALLLWLPWCPPPCRLDDRDRFPPLAVSLQAKHFWRARMCYLEHDQPLEMWKWERWNEQKREARWYYDCYDWLQAAQGGEGRGPDYWLYSLRRVRQLIGEKAYGAGVMPEPEIH